MMTRSGLLIERVELCKGTAMAADVIAREIVRVENGSVYELTLAGAAPGRIEGYLKLIITPDDHVKAYAQESRTSARIFLGTDLDFSDAVSEAIGVLPG